VKLVELTSTYGIFQNGQRLDARAILRVESSVADAPIEDWGNTQSSAADTQHKQTQNQVISPATAYLITDILSDNVARIPAFGENSVLRLPFAAAVKTGTTTDYRDNWTIGYSSERIIGVWVGNADNAPMLDISGVDGAGPIWHDLMLAAHPHTPADFSRPQNVVDVVICAGSGLLPTPDCPNRRSERFIHGTEPTAGDSQYQRIAIDRATGLRATSATPAERRQERVFWVLPPEYHDWMLSQGIALLPPTATTTLPQSSASALSVATPLVLTAPTSNTAYRLRADLPGAAQRIEVGGYVADGRPWATLTLVKDGQAILQVENASRLAGWWKLEFGRHRFWLEGRHQPGGEIERSVEALVEVE
jgi:membrane carboxypeptidase/penicillin-binding protein PbpC